MGRFLYNAGKLLEFVGLVVIAAGLFMSIRMGLDDDGLGSMAMEFRGLGIGGGVFLAGWLLERMAAPGG